MSIRTACAVLLLTVAGARVACAQETGFRVGQLNAGAVVGFGELRGAAMSYGVRIEKAVAPLEDLGDAVFGVQFVADQFSYIVNSAGHSYRFTHTNLQAVANYHLFVEDRRWDPFIGLGLGHTDLRQKARDFGPPIPVAKSAGIFFVFRGGFRYYFTPKVAAYVDAGTGGASVNAGATFKLK